MLLKNALLNNNIVDIEISGKKINAVGKIDNFSGEIIDLKGLSVYPGLIDVHAHGCMGYDTMDAKYLLEMSLYQAKNGITSWLPTTMTMPFEDIKRVTDEDIEKIDGAEIPGFHLEGPYIAKEYKGAQNEEYIKNPDLEEIKQCKNVLMITLAPELEGSGKFIKECGCTVSLGHTAADYETGISAFNAGAKCLTHTFNAMPPFHHRNPSVIGAAIDEDAYVQVICDGFHLHRSAVIALYRIFGSERVVLISDSVRATGIDDGEYEFGGQKIIVKNKTAKLPDGTIAGSTTNLFGCVKKAVEFGISKSEAFKMASYTPARLLGLESKGQIKAGSDADIIAVDDNLNLILSMAGGKIYKNLL